MKALIIGGSSGFGRGIDEALSAYGYSVLSASRSGEIKCDVTDAASVSRLFDNLTSLDVVVYSAGVARGMRTVEEGVEQEWERVFQTNTMGLLRCAKRSIPLLKPTGGIFIYLGSIASTLAYEGGADYCASKAAGQTIMRTLRNELLGTGVRTCLITPGMGAETNFFLSRFDGDVARVESITRGLRTVTPKDMGEAVLNIVRAPKHLNFDEVIIKPLDQSTHGKTILTQKAH